MEGINFFGGPFSRKTENRTEKKKDRIKRKGLLRKRFSSFVERAEYGELRSDIDLSSQDDDLTLEEMLDGVHETGEKLKEHPSVSLIREYKHAVGRFLKFVVENSLSLEERVSGFNILKRKRFTIIKIIDEKLERLAAAVLTNQREQLEVLRRVDEINGLLVDLLS